MCTDSPRGWLDDLADACDDGAVQMGRTDEIADACDDSAGQMSWMDDFVDACDDGCPDASQDSQCFASTEPLPDQLQEVVQEASQLDAVKLLEGFASSWPLRHERKAHLAARLYAELSAWWSGSSQLAMAFLPKRPGESWNRMHRQKAEATLHATLNAAAVSSGDAMPKLAVLEAADLRDRRILPKRDALWCVAVGSAQRRHHFFLLAFDSARGTVRMENAAGRKDTWCSFSFADWHDKYAAYGGYEEARDIYGGGQWKPVAEWQDTFLEAMARLLDVMEDDDVTASCDISQDCFGFRELTSISESVDYPHIVIIEMCRKAALSKPLPASAHSLAPAATESGAGPTVAEFLDGPVIAAWLKKGPNVCHQAAELHRRLAISWPQCAWRTQLFLKGADWEEAYLQSVLKIVSKRVMGRRRPIPPPSIFPATALREMAPPKCDALICVSIGFLESGFAFALNPHPRAFHTFLLYYDAARQAIRTENAWQNRYSFAAWRDDRQKLDEDYRPARMRFGGGRWVPYTLWQQNFWSQLLLAIEAEDFLGSRDYFQHCFGVRPSGDAAEVIGYSKYPFLLLEEIFREGSS